MARIVDPSTTTLPAPRQGGISKLAYGGPSQEGARATMQLGLELGAAGEELYRAQKIEEDRVNTLRAEDAYNKLRQKQLELTFSEEQGFGRLRGAAAVAAEKPILPEYLRRFDNARTEIAAGLSNDRQRERFAQRADVSRMQYEEEIFRHLAKEGDVYAKEVYDATVSQALQDSVSRWNSPGDVAQSLASIQNAVRERGERYSWPEKYQAEKMREEAAKVHTAVVRQAIASGDFRYAQTWYEAHKEDIDLPTATVLHAAVQEGSQKQMVAEFNRDFLGQRNSRPALEHLGARVLGSSLDETRKNLVYGRIVGRIETLDARAERVQLQQERQIGHMITEANGNTLAGMPATIEQLSPIVEMAKGTALEAEANQMVGIANATQSFSKLAPVNQAEAINQAEVQIRKDPTKFDRRLLDAWKQIYDQQQALLAKDPQTFAERQGLVDPMPVDLTAPAAAAPALAQRFAVSRALQAKYGAPNAPLKETEVKILTRALDGAGWKEKRDYLGEIFQATNGDVQGYSGIMSQIAKDHPVTALAGEYAAKGRGQASELMLAGEAILRPGTKTDGKPDGSSVLPMPAEKEFRETFDSTVRDAYAGRVPERNMMYQAAKAIYAKLSADAGDKDTKEVNGDRWEQAISLATGGIYEHNGARIPLPYGMEPSVFKDQVRRRTQDMQDAGALPPGFDGGTLRDLPLMPVGDGRYVFRVGDGVLVTRAGADKQPRPLVLNFNVSPAFRSSGYRQTPSVPSPMGDQVP